MAFGCFTMIARWRNPGLFKKLEAMKKSFGERNGYMIHFAAYTAMPLILGILVLRAGLKGIALF